MSQNNRNNQSNQVAIIAPPRMQMPKHVGNLYGLNEDSWRALIDAVFPLAKTPGAVLMALAICEKRKLDVFARVVHIVPMRVGNKTVETVWPGIGSHRVTAQRQADFFGWDDCEFGPDVEVTYKGKKAKYDQQGNNNGYEDKEVTLLRPEWAQFTVYKMLHGQRIRLPGPKVWFNETFSALSAFCRVPNDRWAQAPRQMIEKCAEAAALRRGWPDVFGDELTFEEAEGKGVDGLPEGEYVEVPEGEEEQRPTRADFATKASPAKKDEAPATKDKPAAEKVDKPKEEVAKTADPVDAEVTQSESSETEERIEADGAPPEPHETWEEWGASVATRLKTAANLVKLDAVVATSDGDFGRAPKPIRDMLSSLYEEKAEDHRQAAQ